MNKIFFLPGFCFLLMMVAACTSSPSNNRSSSAAKPAWVESVDSVYSRSIYVAAVGYASTREMAEKNAFANISATFGQSIYADQKIVNTYQEAVKSGVTAGWTENLDVQNSVQITTSLDSLVGAEIMDTWYDSEGIWYAAAAMDRAKSARLYSDMIRANQDIINNLTAMNNTEKNSFEGMARYQFAGVVADINTSYGNVLSVIGVASPVALKRGDDYRIEAQNIATQIPIGILVNNDRAGRIQGAFAKAFSDLGFRSGGNNSRYMLRVDITTEPVEYPTQPNNKFTRITVIANLTDTSTNTVLVPFNFTERDGHLTQSEADNRVYTRAETKINDEYKDMISDYLSQLSPKR